MPDHNREREHEELARAIHGLTHALVDILAEQKVQFQWMVSHHHFATKTDIEHLNQDLSMKISEVKTAIAAASKAQKEALAEIGTQIADLNQQIQELKDAATDPDVTDAEFLTQINDLQADAKALADIVPGSPSSPTPPTGDENPGIPTNENPAPNARRV